MDESTSDPPKSSKNRIFWHDHRKKTCPYLILAFLWFSNYWFRFCFYYFYQSNISYVKNSFKTVTNYFDSTRERTNGREIERTLWKLSDLPQHLCCYCTLVACCFTFFLQILITRLRDWARKRQEINKYVCFREKIMIFYDWTVQHVVNFGWNCVRNWIFK